MSSVIKTIVAILLVAVLVFLAIDLCIPDKLFSTEILTLNQDVPEGTIITKDMLQKTRVISARKTAIKPEDAYTVFGKEALVPIKAGKVLMPEYFEDPGLVLHEGADEYSFPISTSWLMTDPLGIGRGDEIVLLYGEEEIFSGTVLFAATREEAGFSISEFEYTEGDVVKKIVYDSFCPITIKATRSDIEKIQKYAEQGVKLILIGM